MTFYVYAAYPNQWATVHRAECPHCNDGRGQTGKARKLNTTDWFGPYETREQAFERAERTGLRITACGHCRP